MLNSHKWKEGLHKALGQDDKGWFCQISTIANQWCLSPAEVRTRMKVGCISWDEMVEQQARDWGDNIDQPVQGDSFQGAVET